MSGRIVLHGRAFVSGRFHDDMVIAIERGCITDVHQSTRKDPRRIECDGVIVPGFVDLHVHGGAGADFMDGTADAVNTIAAFHARHGTTALAATTLSASFADITTALGAIAAARHQPRPDAADIVAVHFEGPYLSPERAGAQDPASVRKPDLLEMDSWIAALPGMRWMMTIAPEVEGAHAFFERYHHDVVLSIGHTSCSYAEAVDAIAR
ncbi:MAG: amidohydrolase family protein, partial [Thermoanaerobaculia bacterium]